MRTPDFLNVHHHRGAVAYIAAEEHHSWAAESIVVTHMTAEPVEGHIAEGGHHIVDSEGLHTAADEIVVSNHTRAAALEEVGWSTNVAGRAGDPEEVGWSMSVVEAVGGVERSDRRLLKKVVDRNLEVLVPCILLNQHHLASNRNYSAKR